MKPLLPSSAPSELRDADSPNDANGNGIASPVHELAAQLAATSAALQSLEATVRELAAESKRDRLRIVEILRLLHDDEAGNRRRLYGVRRSAEYAAAYSDPEPLVSIPITTYDRWDLLASRALPSALGQTYPNVEVVVVGDGSPPETTAAVAKFEDPRLRYYNRTLRGPYPDDPRALWHVAGTPPHNEAVSRSRGAWIAPLDDDDEFREDHVELLLEAARAERFELCYGRIHCLMNDGREFALGTFPPTTGHFGIQAAIYHAGLRFFEMELGDALFESPNDWSLCRRMVRAGVRLGMIEDVVVDHWESRFSPEYE
jgi:hypothetical protein